jgi:hypothetical protein
LTSRDHRLARSISPSRAINITVSRDRDHRLARAAKMESANHLKNGASMKSQMSMKNIKLNEYRICYPTETKRTAFSNLREDACRKRTGRRSNTLLSDVTQGIYLRFKIVATCDDCVKIDFNITVAACESRNDPLSVTCAACESRNDLLSATCAVCESHNDPLCVTCAVCESRNDPLSATCAACESRNDLPSATCADCDIRITESCMLDAPNREVVRPLLTVAGI